MTITRADLKIFKPEMLGSSDDAGGQRTKNAVESGKLNELFPAISDIDHAMSAVDIVKCYPALDTVGTELLLDGHIFISQKPTDPLVDMIIAESDVLGDADRMTDMVNILESSVVAGQLIRRGLIGLLAGQDSFPGAYLQSSYMFNGTEYWDNVTIYQGTTIVISVEYPGAENSLYPRFEHFCTVTKTVTGGKSGVIVPFEPAIPYNTPDPHIVLGGESGCTKLRYTSQNDGIKYHGVANLTAANTTNEIAVGSTTVDLLPKVVSVNPLTNNSISASGTSDVPTTVIKKNVSQPVVSGQYTYIFEVADLFDDEYVTEVLGLKTAVAGINSTYSWAVSVTGTTVTATVTSYGGGGYGSFGGVGSNVVTLSYVSSNKYEKYLNSTGFPAFKKIAIGTTTMTITFLDTGYGNLVLKEGDNGYFSNGGQNFVQLDYNTGGTTKFLDARGDFTIAYTSLIEAAVSAENVASFTLVTGAPILDTFYVVVNNAAGDTLLSGSSDINGVITGSGIDSGLITGRNVLITFTQAVDLTSLRYDISETVTLSPPPELYGLNPLRIKNGGVVNAFTAWNAISVQHTQTQVVTSPAPAQTYNARANARFVDITDAEGKSLWTVANTHYTWVKATGVVTINSDFTGFTAPFILTDTIGEIALVTEVKPTSLVLAAALSQSYPIGAVVSSVQNLGDLQARVGTVRDMTAWSNNWDLDGDPATGNLNTVDYPIEVRNDTAVNEDWVLIFTSATAFRCVGKRLGQIATGDTLNDFAPINPLTLLPYFIIRVGAFGGGWNAGEAIRFMTYAASKPVMLLRTVQSGHSQITTDRAVLAFRGNES